MADARREQQPAQAAPRDPGLGDARTPVSRSREARRAFTVLGIVVVVILAMVGGCIVMTRNQESTDDAQIDAAVVAIAARTGGQVVSVTVENNQRVAEGDPILKIDDTDPAARVAQAEGQLVVAQAQRDAMQNQERVAAAALDHALADAKRADLDLERVRGLRQAGAGTQQRLDDAQATSDMAGATVAQARATLAAARAQSESAQGQVKIAEATLALAQSQLAYTTVTAPANGVISNLSINKGEIISPGQPIAELVPTDIHVVANFKETQIGRMRPGDRAEIKVDALPGRTFKGEVESLSGGTGARFSLLPPDNASGNFVKVVQRVPVRIRWLSPMDDLRLQAGLSAEVKVFVGGGDAGGPEEK
jgi:membrane fusion protein (multidrug efflux system)